MNTVQRLFSNAFLAFTSNVIVRLSSTLLFIVIGRQLGPTESGTFSLGVIYYTFVFGLSAWGLQELLVREVAPRRDESGRYLVNYLALRLLLTLATYALLVGGLRLFQPYAPETNQVILILALAAIPEAIFSICQALFEAHEQLIVPAAAAVVNSAIKLAGGFWLLARGGDVVDVAWVMPLGSALSLLVFVPGLVRLFRRVPQRVAGRLDLPFAAEQFRATPGFFVIHLFSLLDYQADALLISLMLGETELGYYAAAQAILLGFNLVPVAVRAAVYPLMSRYHTDAPDKLAILYEKVTYYLIVLALPIAVGVSLLAGPIIELIYGPAFGPAAAVLSISIWAVVFLYLNVPDARLMLVHNRQRQASILMGVSMALNVALNLLLIPRFGIAGAAATKVLATALLFVSFHLYTRRTIMAIPLLRLFGRPLLATALMAVPVWLLREQMVLIPVVAGAAMFGVAAYLLRLVPNQDIAYWRQLVASRA